jgi:hypothetical protein
MEYLQLQDGSILHLTYLIRVEENIQGGTYQIIFTTTTDQYVESYDSEVKADYRFQQMVTRFSPIRYVDPPDNIGVGPEPKE